MHTKARIAPPPPGFVLALDGAIDYLSHDGKTAIEVKSAAKGRQGVHSAAMQLALFLEERKDVDRACLVLRDPQMSLAGLRAEWKSLRRVLRGPIARRLGVVVLGEKESWSDPDDPEMGRIVRALSLQPTASTATEGAHIPRAPGRKTHEVVKVLLNRWLQVQGPMALGELSRVVGCSYPTVRQALDRPSLRPVLRFKSNRAVEFTAFPHACWRELLALSGTLRYPIRFRDRSGESPKPRDLLRRLERSKPPGVALGGVTAARHWHPDFDLHGMPRLDLVYHAPISQLDLRFVQELDPALTQVDDPLQPAILAIHPLVRAAPLFVGEADHALPWADPVETALDLCELSLTTQANQLLTHLRPEVRLA